MDDRAEERRHIAELIRAYQAAQLVEDRLREELKIAEEARGERYHELRALKRAGYVRPTRELTGCVGFRVDAEAYWVEDEEIRMLALDEK